MRRLFFILALCSDCIAAQASDFIRATIVITNVPVSADGLTNNAAVRVWTNVNTASFILTNSVGTKEATTNLYNHISKSQFGGSAGFPKQGLSWSNATSIVLYADAPLVVGIRGGWGYVTHRTNAIAQEVTYLSTPIDRLALADRTNNATDITYGSRYSTTPFVPNSTAMQHMANLTTPQTMSNKTQVAVTNVSGLETNVELKGVIVANYPAGTNGYGIKFGNNWLINDGFQLSLVQGDGDAAEPTFGPHIVTLKWGALLYPQFGGTNTFSARNIFNGTGIFNGTNIFNGGFSVSNALIYALNVFGASFSNAWAQSFANTNTVNGGTNVMAGRYSYPRAANSSLVNGNNANILLGTNYFITLSGPTGISELAGFAAEPDGTFHIVQCRGAGSNWLVNYTGSGRATDAIAANRIETCLTLPAGSQDILMTNNPSIFGIIYDGSVSRWQVVWYSH